MRRGDRLRVADILDAIEKIERWSTDPVANTDVYRAAVLRELGVLGEAAAHLSNGFRRDHAEIPWRQIAGLRNSLIHEYWDTAWTVVEGIIRDDLPELKASLPTREGGANDQDVVARFLASAGGRAPLSGPRQPAAERRACGAWMPLARAYCTLAPRHGGHHRSK